MSLKTTEGDKTQHTRIIVPLILLFLLILIIGVLVIGIYTTHSQKGEIAEISRKPILGAGGTTTESIGTNVNASFDSSTGEIIIASTSEIGEINREQLFSLFDTIGRENIITITFENEVYAPWNGYGLFRGVDKTYSLDKLTNINNINNLNTSKVTTMEAMFQNCTSLTSLDLSSWDTSNVEIMMGMFQECHKLTTIGDVSSWNTSKVTNMRSMFDSCKVIPSINVSSWKTENVTTMYNMFNTCNNLTTLDVSSWKTENVTDMGNMFDMCNNLATLDVSNWNTSNVTNMENMFSMCRNLTTLDVSNWNTENVTNMKSLFFSCGNLTTLDVGNWNTENVTDMSALFCLCEKLTTIDVSNWNTINVIDMHQMFDRCRALTELNVSKWDMQKVTDIGIMFSMCSSLTELNVSEWNTSSVTNMGQLFEGCSSLTTLDVSNWNTENVTAMGNIFSGCSNLTTLDLSNWNTRNVTKLPFMFSGCTNLTSIGNTSNWDTTNVTNMKRSFFNCSSLTTINMSNWDISAVTNTADILSGCTSLTEIYTPKICSTQAVNLPSDDWYNLTNATDNNAYSTFKNDTFSDTVHLRKLVDYNIIYNLNDGLEEGNPSTYNILQNFTLNNPTKQGYTFTGWTGANGEIEETEVSINGREQQGDLEYTANWTASTDTPYTVKHWQQNLRGNVNFEDNKNYTLVETENNLTGTTGENVTPEVKTYEGFTSPTKETVTILADGTAEVNYYYTRNNYELTLNKGTGILNIIADGNASAETNEPSENQTKTYLYGETITINAELKQNTEQYTYEWEKWTVEPPFEQNETNISEITEKQYTFTMPAQDISLTANGTETINEYLQTVQVRYENADGTFTEYENIINQNYNYGEEISWNLEETDIYQSASIETYTVTEPKETQVTIYRKTYTIMLNKGIGIESVSIKDTRQSSYNLSEDENPDAENVSNQGTYRAGEEITINAELTEGYLWSKWTNGENEITEQEHIIQMPTENTTLTANAILNTNIPYVVKHWQENLNVIVSNGENDTTNVGDAISRSEDYTLVETENLAGATGQTVTPNTKEYTGFIAPETQTKEILSNGTLEINYYYLRRKDLGYTVKYLEKETNKQIKNDKKVGNQTFETEIVATDEIIDDIYGYNYDSVSTNTLKITTEENILNIYYTKKDSKVIVHHYIYDMETGNYTESKLIPDIEIEGKVGDTYTTSKSSEITSNYNCINEEPENYTGEMGEETIEISYYYELVTPKAESSVNSQVKTEVEKDENGRYIISKDEEVEYLIEYETKVEDYIGKVTMEITATLPAEIDPEKSDLKQGIYNPETNKITWIEERNIDTFENGVYTEKVEKEITIMYKESSLLDNIGIKVEGKTILYYPDNYLNKGGEVFLELQKINSSKVIVHHYIYDIEKNKETMSKLINDVEVKGVVGGEYTARKSSNIPKNYEVVNETPVGYTGKMTKEPIEVNYYYKLIEARIEDNVLSKIATEVEKDKDGKYIIANNKEVKYQVEYEAKVEDYIGEVTIEITATLPAEIDLSKSDIKGGVYNPETNTIVWTEERDVDTLKNGVYTEKIEKEITIVYKEETTLDDIRIKVDGKTIVYYPNNYIDKGGQISGNVKYTRRKIGKTIVKYVDIETNKEIANDYEIIGNPGDDYKTEKKDIPYYKYEKDSNNTKGKITEEDIEVTYYYRKLNFNFKVENTISSITLNGEKLRISNNRLAKIEIETKKLQNTELIVKYNIKVTNDGELKGTAKIVETIPNGYELIEMNGWKQTSDGTLQRDVELEAGQSTNLELALKWKNADKNLGSKINTSKIESTINLANYEESNKEDNIATSTIIVSIKTGVVVSIIIIVMIITSLIICGYVIISTTHGMGKGPDINKIRFLMKK